MHLLDALRLGYECSMRTVGDTLNMIDSKAPQIFTYNLIGKELFQLKSEWERVKKVTLLYEETATLIYEETATLRALHYLETEIRLYKNPFWIIKETEIEDVDEIELEKIALGKLPVCKPCPNSNKDLKKVHEDGIGINPNGVFCGECGENTCKECEHKGRTKSYPLSNNEFLDLCKGIVVKYHNKHIKSDKHIKRSDIFIVWSCKTLQNNKALLSTNISDGMYYEITYNGNKQEVYVDAYKKQENFVVKL